VSTDEPATATAPPTPTPPPLITAHARERFNRRVALRDLDWLGLDLHAAFARAVPVGVPEADDRARLHAPSGAIFIFKGRREQSPVVVTTIHERQADPNDDHLKLCGTCGLRFDPRRDCQWCEPTTGTDWE
jgi:hypothetical protein